MFDDVERQELFIKDISSINAEIDVENINDSEEEIGYMCYDQQPELNNTVTSTQLPRINTLPVPPYIDTDAKLMKLLRCQKPVIKRNGFNSINNNTLPQVTEVPGSRGPKWVAMHQSPYKTVYREQTKNKIPLKTSPKRKHVALTEALLDIDGNRKTFPVRFHVEARNGKHLVNHRTVVPN